MKGVSEDAFRVFLTKRPCSANILVSECKKLEVAQQNRLEQHRFGRLTNAIPAKVQAPHSTASVDFRSAICEARREKLRF